jgi:hypothetical protein
VIDNIQAAVVNAAQCEQVGFESHRTVDKITRNFITENVSDPADDERVLVLSDLECRNVGGNENSLPAVMTRSASSRQMI